MYYALFNIFMYYFRAKTVRGASDKRESGGEPRDGSQHHYRQEEQQRTKRKRERDSLSDSEQRDSKRPRNEVTEKHSHKESSRDKKDRKESGTSEDDVGHQQKKSSRKHKRQSESEADNDVAKSDLDWVSLARLTRPKLPLSSNCLNDHKAGPILASLGLSPTLAGPKLTEQIHIVVKEHLTSKYGNLLPESLLDNPFGGCGLASASVSHLQDEIKESQACHNIGSCRRALTAQADFMLRKKLRKCEEKLVNNVIIMTINVCICSLQVILQVLVLAGLSIMQPVCCCIKKISINYYS